MLLVCEAAVPDVVLVGVVAPPTAAAAVIVVVRLLVLPGLPPGLDPDELVDEADDEGAAGPLMVLRLGGSLGRGGASP